MFKRGNKVIFIGNGLHYNLTYNKTYVVKSSFVRDNLEQIIQIVNDSNKFIWMSSNFFNIGICEERKQKLKNICLSQETK